MPVSRGEHPSAEFHGHTIRAKSVCEKRDDTDPTMKTDIDETCHVHTVGEAGGYSEVHCRLLPRPTLASRPGTLRPVARHRRDARTTATRTCWTRYFDTWHPLGKLP